jgi:N-methylhydantoinase A/oxoprolinase/acetone carboxylase beta subunit
MGVLSLVCRREDAIALDIGGTTTDIAVFADGVPLLENPGVTIDGQKTLIRGLRTRSIGAGGDSRVKWENGQLVIGPEREGPAAAFGGPCPTPTDAMIVLDLTSIGDRVKAAMAIAPLAQQMDCPVQEAARRLFAEFCGIICGHVRTFVDEINQHPVYTIHEMLEGKRLTPTSLYLVGGPAAVMAVPLGNLLGCTPHMPEHAEVANAVGAALARTTAEINVMADTERKTLTIGEEGYQMPIPHDFTREDAIRIGRERLYEKAIQIGAKEEDLEIEVVEEQEFNMIKASYTVGKNIRLKLQIKPGLISGYDKEEGL